MKIKTEQLPQYLTKNSTPLYLVSGDEFLLVQEACDTIRKHMMNDGYKEREVFYVEPNFNWELFLSSVNNASLFSDKTLIELHLKSKLTDSGSKILQNYAKNPVPDKIILIVTNKLDASQQKAAWFKTIDTYGIIIQIWPIEPTQLPSWITKRLRLAGLNADHQGIEILVEHVAGNLLAAIQEIEKLALLYGTGNLTAEQISTAITDNSRFSIFNLLDAAISNKINTTNRILNNLKNDDIEPTLILWTLTNELRLLINISFDIQCGTNFDQAVIKNKVWHNRKPLIKKILSKYNLIQLQNFLKSALAIDLIIKGANKQNLLWHELNKLYLNFADNSSPPPSPLLT